MYVFVQHVSVIFVTLHQYLYTYSPNGATSCEPHFETEAILMCDLITLTFDRSTSKWAGLPSCQFSASYALPFSTYGQTQHRTDRHMDR